MSDDAAYYQDHKDDPDEWGEPIHPQGYRCEHFNIAIGEPGRLTDVTSPCGCKLQPVYE